MQDRILKIRVLASLGPRQIPHRHPPVPSPPALSPARQPPLLGFSMKKNRPPHPSLAPRIPPFHPRAERKKKYPKRPPRLDQRQITEATAMTKTTGIRGANHGPDETTGLELPESLGQRMTVAECATTLQPQSLANFSGEGFCRNPEGNFVRTKFPGKFYGGFLVDFLGAFFLGKMEENPPKTPQQNSNQN